MRGDRTSAENLRAVGRRSAVSSSAAPRRPSRDCPAKASRASAGELARLRLSSRTHPPRTLRCRERLGHASGEGLGCSSLNLGRHPRPRVTPSWVEFPDAEGHTRGTFIVWSTAQSGTASGGNTQSCMTATSERLF